jgi:hypothetical protein
MKRTENELIQRALDDLVQMGLIMDSGEAVIGKSSMSRRR